MMAQAPQMGNASFSGKNLPFLGFTFTKNSKLSDTGMEKLSKPEKMAKNSSPVLNGENRIYDEKMTQQKSYISSLERTISTIKQELNGSQKLIEELKEIDFRKSSKIETLESDLAKINSEIAQQKEEKDSFSRKLRKVETEAKVAKENLKQIYSEKEDVMRSKARLESDLRNSENNRQELAFQGPGFLCLTCNFGLKFN